MHLEDAFLKRSLRGSRTLLIIRAVQMHSWPPQTKVLPLAYIRKTVSISYAIYSERLQKISSPKLHKSLQNNCECKSGEIFSTTQASSRPKPPPLRLSPSQARRRFEEQKKQQRLAKIHEMMAHRREEREKSRRPRNWLARCDGRLCSHDKGVTISTTTTLSSPL